MNPFSVGKEGDAFRRKERARLIESLLRSENFTNVTTFILYRAS